MRPLTIQYCSDLHLEFPKNRDFYQKNPIVPKGNILILAGDIIPFTMLEYIDWFFDELKDQFEAVYWIAGNHEYYGSDINFRSGNYHEKIRRNIHLVNNYKLDLDECEILFTTLWSEILPQNYMHIQRGMSDYHHIKKGNQSFTPNDSGNLYKENLDFLATEMEASEIHKKRIVVTHHVPTYKNYPEKYKNSPLNDAFATELSSFIMDHTIDYWIYGHSHCNVADFKIGKTVLTNNQLGYVGQVEHLNYRRDALIRI
jgi:predicted phosphodiesterase